MKQARSGQTPNTVTYILTTFITSLLRITWAFASSLSDLPVVPIHGTIEMVLPIALRQLKDLYIIRIMDK
jgi:hypothetical protein